MGVVDSDGDDDRRGLLDFRDHGIGSIWAAMELRCGYKLA
jgi:hypothetical protein